MTTTPIYSSVDKSWFDHINIDHTNWDGTCPLQDDIEVINNSSVIDPDSEHMSWLLSQILDSPGLVGTREIVRNRRKVRLFEEYIGNARDESLIKTFTGGSQGDGFAMFGGDIDVMCIDRKVMVTYPDQYHLIPDDSRHKTVLFMREADCQPGYVALELGCPGQCSPEFFSAIVPFADSRYISSDLLRQGYIDMLSRDGVDHVSNGPCSTIIVDGNHGDLAFSFPCTCWPKEADEWVHRSRLYGWPSHDLRDKIVQSGCHLVPVGDKCSQDTFLQWRISFLTAERRLVHSLRHQQFRIYGLLKYFLKQITDLLESLLGDADVLCSYFMKTLIFYAVENSPLTFWQVQNTSVCFRFCLRILINWVQNGNCPNYFIKNNNMFKRKIHGENQQKLLHILTDVYHIKWASLSVGTVFQPSIGTFLHQAVHGRLQSRGECDRDIDIFSLLALAIHNTSLTSPLRLLSESKSDIDEFIAYYITAATLCNMAKSTFADYTTPGSNKQKYRDLRKCKHLMTPRAAMCTSPGLLELATFHYLTGNYRKSLAICGEVTSSRRCYLGNGHVSSDKDMYTRKYCNRGYNLYYKLKEGCVGNVVFRKFNVVLCLPHLRLDVTKRPLNLSIPPLPYAVFLSFLCYHDLGDTMRRDAALLHLQALNSDPEQGGHKHGIVHTLLGICYQTVGDNGRAIRSYTDSVHVMRENNSAIERIAVVYLVMCYRILSADDRR